MVLARVPFLGPVGAVRLGRVDGQYVVLPTAEEIKQSDLDLVVASTSKAIVMIEGFGQELPEPEMLDAIMTAHRHNQEIIALQHDLLAASGLPPYDPPTTEPDSLLGLLYERYSRELRDCKQIHLKADRNNATKELLKRALAELAPEDGTGQYTSGQVKGSFHHLEEKVVRELILDGRRPDGRGPRDLRPISCEVSVLPRAHGSAIFQRGETQALVTTVLGTGADEQRVDGIMDEYSKKFMLDYNMPHFAVGEVRPIRGPGRREIGHGALAERSVAPILPSPAQFPYTIRVVSDILESNGSSSMASVCGATLSLMDAGVPISDPVGGISIGLVQDESSGRFILLTDIIGDEDHFGDMDFKVAGTQRGVTGIQLDLKNQGITEEIVRQTLDQAHEARLEILRAMLRSIKRPRDEISANAPRLIQIQINPEKIGLVIGPGGKTIRRLQEETGAKIDIEDSGIVTIASSDSTGAEAARDKIQAMTEGVQVGRIYEGRVSSIKDFGAFVEILPGKDGLVHISELSEGYVASVTDICRVGDTMLVKAIAVDDQDRVKLSRMAALAERGERDPYAEAHPASERPPGGGDRGGPPRRGGGDRGGYGGDRGPRRGDRD
ncbi:MAG: polyribonucleotide nucleotidyltransferase [Isosphaeraceae bacterium]